MALRNTIFMSKKLRLTINLTGSTPTADIISIGSQVMEVEDGLQKENI